MGKQLNPKLLREQRDEKVAAFQQCAQSVEALVQQLRGEQTRRERLLGGISSLNELLIAVDPEGPEAQAQEKEKKKPRKATKKVTKKVTKAVSKGEKE